MRNALTLCLAAAISFTALISSPALAGGTALKTKRVLTGVTYPTWVGHAPGDNNRIFIIEKRGAIRIYDKSTSTLLTTPFLDIDVSLVTNGTSSSDEQGLLGMAFHPDYTNNGVFFVYYTGGTSSAYTNVVRRYNRNAANPNLADIGTGATVLSWADPYTNHNGGCINFGPDGYLYIGTGDGGSANDPAANAQNVNAYLGKMLRIAPAVTGTNPMYTNPKSNPYYGAIAGLDQIAAIGLRNPWRWSFDRLTGDIVIGDVGQNASEEIDWVSGASFIGRNFGWRCTEGATCTGLTGCTCNAATLTPAIRTHAHAAGTAGGYCITGGNVYRGCAMPDMNGIYFYADYSTNNFWSMRYVVGGAVTEHTVRNTELGTSVDGFVVNQIVAFGEDVEGEIYVVDHGSGAGTGQIFKIIPATGEVACAPPCIPADIDCNGYVNGADLATLLNNWGGTGVGDIDGSGTVDAADLAAMLNVWTP
ncbi:MAG: hypothetical protein EXS10_05455 [Phycisphaerales bacterium]|nr:hypothetical protein [Phycisphaerales bacterium]